jgi:hypothetical protein
LNNFKTEPNATENCEKQKENLKKTSIAHSSRSSGRKKKKKEKPAQKKQDSARQSIIIKTT